MKRGFTLIELLAVIVILAIIALIATPIILNIINDARKESQQRSVEYVGNALEYAVTSYLYDNNGNSDGLTLESIEPYFKADNAKYQEASNGYEIQDNNGNKLCSVELIGGNIVIGCENYDFEKIIPCKDAPKYVQISDDSTVCSGYDAIKIGDEAFCILSSDDTTITMLSEKVIELTTNRPKQTSNTTNNNISFSNSYYWSDYDQNNLYVYNSSSNLYEYVEAYKRYLQLLGLDVIEARLISIEELQSQNCNINNMTCKDAAPWITLSSGSYWTGSTGVSDSVYVSIATTWILQSPLMQALYGANNGIRPVIKIKK